MFVLLTLRSLLLDSLLIWASLAGVMSAEAHYPSPEGEVVNAAAQYPSPEGSEHSWAVAGPDEDLNFSPLMAQEDLEAQAAADAAPQVPLRQPSASPAFRTIGTR